MKRETFSKQLASSVTEMNRVAALSLQYSGQRLSEADKVMGEWLLEVPRDEALKD